MNRLMALSLFGLLVTPTPGWAILTCGAFLEESSSSPQAIFRESRGYFAKNRSILNSKPLDKRGLRVFRELDPSDWRSVKTWFDIWFVGIRESPLEPWMQLSDVAFELMKFKVLGQQFIYDLNAQLFSKVWDQYPPGSEGHLKIKMIFSSFAISSSYLSDYFPFPEGPANMNRGAIINSPYFKLSPYNQQLLEKMAIWEIFTERGAQTWLDALKISNDGNFERMRRAFANQVMKFKERNRDLNPRKVINKYLLTQREGNPTLYSGPEPSNKWAKELTYWHNESAIIWRIMLARPEARDFHEFLEAIPSVDKDHF